MTTSQPSPQTIQQPAMMIAEQLHKDVLAQGGVAGSGRSEEIGGRHNENNRNR